MVGRKRWRIVGIKNGGINYRAITRQLEYHHSVISRLIQNQAQTNDIKDRSRSERLNTIFVNNDRNLLRLVNVIPSPTHLQFGSSEIRTEDSSSRRLEIV